MRLAIDERIFAVSVLVVGFEGLSLLNSMLVIFDCLIVRLTN